MKVIIFGFIVFGIVHYGQSLVLMVFYSVMQYPNRVSLMVLIERYSPSWSGYFRVWILCLQRLFGRKLLFRGFMRLFLGLCGAPEQPQKSVLPPSDKSSWSFLQGLSKLWWCSVSFFICVFMTMSFG